MSNPLELVLGIGEKLIDKLFPDPAKKAEALLELKKLEQSGDLAVIAGQVEINKIEAANPNVFISGWRPFVGWICASALAYYFIISPFLITVAGVFGRTLVVPTIDVSLLVTLLISMLGLGGMRTIEKLSNAESHR